MTFLELAWSFVEQFIDPQLLAGAALLLFLVGAAVLGFATSSPLAAAVVLAPVGAVAALVGWALRRSAKRRPPPQPVYLGVLPDATVLVAGRATALVAASSPVTRTPCVYWCLRVVSAEVSGTPDDGYAALTAEDSESGVFLIDDGEGKALVWPDGRIRFASGWHESLKGEGDRDVAERLVPEGATVSVIGRAGSLERMMTEMSQRALELPPPLLKALQTRPDLRSLPCFWPRSDADFRVAEGPPEALMSAVGGRGETLFSAGLATMGFAAVLVLGVVFRLF